MEESKLAEIKWLSQAKPSWAYCGARLKGSETMGLIPQMLFKLAKGAK